MEWFDVHFMYISGRRAFFSSAVARIYKHNEIYIN